MEKKSELYKQSKFLVDGLWELAAFADEDKATKFRDLLLRTLDLAGKEIDLLAERVELLSRD